MSIGGRFNGAYYYSVEIERNIIPRVKTDRNWITVNVPGIGAEHSIVFIHNNLNPQNYQWLTRFNDLILVCGVPETMGKVESYGRPMYLPLSIDTEEVLQYRTRKTKEIAYVGRASKAVNIPDEVDRIQNLSRKNLLKAMAEYKKVYAVGRCAIEAKCLGCEVLPYDPRYLDPSIWEVLDNKNAAVILQRELNRLDGLQE